MNPDFLPRLLEFAMLFCFGFSWPFAIAKTIRAKRVDGKSPMFEIIVIVGYLFGIGISGLTDLFTSSILADNLFLLAAAIFFAIPVFPYVWKRWGEKIPYTAQRILKTAVVILFVGASTVRLVGNSYSPFLYFRF